MDGGLNTYGYVSGTPLTQIDPDGRFGAVDALGGAGMSVFIQYEICNQLGGSFSTCAKCINLVDVAISAGTGAIAPTWLGNVGKGLFQLTRNARTLRSLGGPGLANMAASSVARDAKGAATGTLGSWIAKANLPSWQFGCDDECKKYRLGAEAMDISTSFSP